MRRSTFLKRILMLPLISDTGQQYINPFEKRDSVIHLRTSLNAYSFNSLLRGGEMSVMELIEYCSINGFDGLDLTGYYLPGYPDVPKDDFLFDLKKKCFLQGISLSGTGVRNNFITHEKEQIVREIGHVKNWIVAASKIGAPIVRIFASGGGIGPQEEFSDMANKRLVSAITECINFAKARGVIIGLQNHDNYLKNADQIIEIVRLVDSEWFGIVLDIGSFSSTNDPYEEIRKVAPFAKNWQIKEYVFSKGRSKQKVDLEKIVKIVTEVKYKGFLPIETLDNQPLTSVPLFHEKLKEAINGAKNKMDLKTINYERTKK